MADARTEMTRYKDIYDYIMAEENAFNLPISPIDGWEWGMKAHVKMTTLYKNGQLLSGFDDNKPVKNIVLPVLNLRYRTEGYDVKDIEIFIDDPEYYFKSFLIKKYHDEIWARENKIDTFIDKKVESAIDFGGVLVKKLPRQAAPEVVPLQSVAFCDQTDILSGPIGLMHFYSPDQLKDMEAVGWGDKKNGATITIDDLITYSTEDKTNDSTTGNKSATPGRYIKIYEVHGTLPESFLDDAGSETKYVKQFQIVGFYTNTDGIEQGVCLFKKKEEESPFKFESIDEIYGRALGRGGVEELSEAQVWTNYSMIRMKDMLDAASKVILQTDDASVAKRQNLRNMKTLQIVEMADGKRIDQVNLTPVNLPLFENAVKEWTLHSQVTGSATDALLGEAPSAGTPFALQNLLTQQGLSLHEYRMGKHAVFMEEIYRDWVIPEIVKDILKGQTFLAELSLSELQQIADSLVLCKANEFIKEKILNGELIDPADLDAEKQRIRDEFMRGGNKRFLEILKGEMKDAPLRVRINIKGKQKDLAKITDKLTNIIREVIAAPQILQDPAMAKIFNEILEFSGLSPIDLSGYKPPIPAPPEMANPSKLPALIPQ